MQRTLDFSKTITYKVREPPEEGWLSFVMPDLIRHLALATDGGLDGQGIAFFREAFQNDGAVGLVLGGVEVEQGLAFGIGD